MKQQKTLSHCLQCSCGSYQLEALTPYDEKVKLYCIDCGTYHFLTAQQYFDFSNNYIERKILNIQFRNNLKKIRCQN